MIQLHEAILLCRAQSAQIPALILFFPVTNGATRERAYPDTLIYCDHHPYVT